MNQDASLAGIDLNLLVVLDVLLAERSVSAAARRLACGQPAISKKLATLRALLGDPLLVRQGRAMYPTPRAQELAQPLSDALRTLREALAAPSEFEPSTARGLVRLGIRYTGMTLIPELVRCVGTLAPGIDIQVLELVGRGPHELLARGDIDLIVQAAAGDGVVGIRRGGHADRLADALFQQRLYSDGWCCVVRSGHPTIRGPLTLAEYVSMPHVLMSLEGDPYGFVDAALERAGKARRIAVLVQDLMEACLLAARTDYILTTNVAVALVMRELLPLAIHAVPLELPRGHVRNVWHERTHHDPMHRWLRQQLHQVGRELDERLTRTTL